MMARVVYSLCLMRRQLSVQMLTERTLDSIIPGLKGTTSGEEAELPEMSDSKQHRKRKKAFVSFFVYFFEQT